MTEVNRRRFLAVSGVAAGTGLVGLADQALRDDQESLVVVRDLQRLGSADPASQLEREQEVRRHLERVGRRRHGVADELAEGVEPRRRRI